MKELTFEHAVELARAKDERYKSEAYDFVRQALDHTQDITGKKPRGIIRQVPAPEHHVTGQELLEGARDLALKQFGPMAVAVLEEWGIHRCEDIGEIVFNLIDVGLFGKTEKDTKADFAGRYDFFEAFRKPFLPESKKQEAAKLKTEPINLPSK